jgi:hypothetical protein
MHGETLLQETVYFHPFPAPEDVFARDVQRHSEFLLPLATVDLSHLSPNWDGKLHFVLPIEPNDGVVGEETKPYHNYLCRDNWIGYNVVSNKYELACDFGFFLKSHDNVPSGRRALQARQALETHYERVCEGFRLRRSHFQEQRCMHNAWARKKRSGGYADADRVALVRDLGGVSLGGNWAQSGDFPLSRYDHVDDQGEK